MSWESFNVKNLRHGDLLFSDELNGWGPSLKIKPYIIDYIIYKSLYNAVILYFIYSDEIFIVPDDVNFSIIRYKNVEDTTYEDASEGPLLED
jgi:hypothetical protein